MIPTYLIECESLILWYLMYDALSHKLLVFLSL